MKGVDYIFDIYKDKRTVFRLSDIAMLFPQAENKYLANKMGYYVKTGKLLNLRKGVYAKPGYNPLEFANLLYTPSYISLEYVLQQAGVVFQYDSRYTSVSYLSREVEVDGNTFSYRRIKEIYEDKELSGILGFKGGTALMFFYDLPRFSVDLDFNLLNSSKEDMVYEKVRKIILKHGSIHDEAKKFYGIICVLDYGMRERKLKVEISNRNYDDKYEIKLL